MLASQQVTKSTLTNLLIKSFCKLYICISISYTKSVLFSKYEALIWNPKKSYVFDWNSITSRCSFQKSCRQQQINSVLFIYPVLEVELLQKQGNICANLDLLSLGNLSTSITIITKKTERKMFSVKLV